MQRSHKILGISLVLVLGLLLSASTYQGKVVLKNKSRAQPNEQPVLKMDSVFQAVEDLSVPSFKHVVVDFPRHLVLINQSEQFSGVKFKSKVPQIRLANFAKVEVRNDTLFLKGKINLWNYRFAYEGKTNGNAVEKWVEYLNNGYAFRLSIQGPTIESITLLQEAKAEILMQYANYSDSDWMNKVWSTSKQHQLAFTKEYLVLHLNRNVDYSAFLNADKVEVQYDSGDSMGNLSGMNGQIKTLRINNLIGRFGQTNGLSVDSLFLEGTAITRDHLNFRIKDYLYTDVEPIGGLHLKYYEEGEPITIEGTTNKYQLITRVN